jgi:DNA-binding CsgD family transcriptional regulator
MTDRQRVVAQMYSSGMSSHQIAKVLGISQQSVWITLQRAKVVARPRVDAIRLRARQEAQKDPVLELARQIALERFG